VAIVVLVGLLLSLAMVGANPPLALVVFLVVIVGCAVGTVAWTLRHTRRQRRRYEDELTAWAAERATNAERLRIARDLHDLASHGLGLITVRAAAARTLTGPTASAERAAALTDIEHAGRQATTELRRMLAVLRTPTAPLRPAESLDDLDRILTFARTSGVTASLDRDDLGEVSGGTQLAICAIVREALANTARHAGPTRAHVLIRREAEFVITTVTDEGPVAGWAPHAGAGTGLTALQERVTALGGTLWAQPTPHGFELQAKLPR
jgi:signal transduction histidine kinase